MGETIRIGEEDHEFLQKSCGREIVELVSHFDGIRDGVLKAAEEKGLDDNQTAEIVRAVLVKTAAENSRITELLKKVSAGLAPVAAKNN